MCWASNLNTHIMLRWNEDEKCNTLFVHLTCASTEVPRKTWTNIHGIIIHILNGFTAFKILTWKRTVFAQKMWFLSTLSSMCAVPAAQVVISSSIFALHGEWTQHLLKAKWIEYHHLQQKHSFRQTREMRLCAIHWSLEVTMLNSKE